MIICSYDRGAPEAREKLLRCEAELIPWEVFDRVINSCDGGSGIGGDLIENAMVKGAPKAARQAYLGLLHTVQRECRWPRQAYTNLVALIGKAGGGERAVGIMCGAYRIYCKCAKPQIDEWSQSQTRFWDDAVKGSAPLQAALRRTMFAECEAADAKHVAFAFGDYKSFYDTLEWAAVFRCADNLEYPKEPIVLGAQLHFASRVLVVDGCLC